MNVSVEYQKIGIEKLIHPNYYYFFLLGQLFNCVTNEKKVVYFSLWYFQYCQG